MGRVRSYLLVGVAVGLMGGALGAEWWTSRGEFCLNKCSLGGQNFYWCYTVDPNNDTKVYRSTGHPDFFQYRDGVLVDMKKRWDYCTPNNEDSSWASSSSTDFLQMSRSENIRHETSLDLNSRQCANICSNIGGRSLCSPKYYEDKSLPTQTVKLSSDGDASKFQKESIGTYTKTTLTDPVQGYPVYELKHKINNKTQYLFSYHTGNSWYWMVGPNFKSINGSVLKSSNAKPSPTPHKDNWFFLKNGTWVKDNWMEAIVNVAPRGLVTITSSGNANNYQESRMGTYTQLNFLVNGYPVYRQTNSSANDEVQFMFVANDDTWRVGPNVGTGKETGLKNTNKGSSTPPRKDWMYLKDGEWRQDLRTTATIEMEGKDWFYCSQDKPLKREQISAVEQLWCIGECTQTDGSDFTCPTMFGRDKCSPKAGLNVKGEKCMSQCLPDGDTYKCYTDNQLRSYELCGHYGTNFTQKQSLEFAHGGYDQKICAGLCEFPSLEEKEYKVCQVVSWEIVNFSESSLKMMSKEVCWGAGELSWRQKLILAAILCGAILCGCGVISGITKYKKRDTQDPCTCLDVCCLVCVGICEFGCQICVGILEELSP